MYLLCKNPQRTLVFTFQKWSIAFLELPFLILYLSLECNYQKGLATIVPIVYRFMKTHLSKASERYTIKFLIIAQAFICLNR